MSAIIPHLGHPSEATPMETQYWRCVAGEPQLRGVFSDGTACPNPHLILRKNHMELLAMVYVRNAVEASLQGRTFIVQQGKPQLEKDGSEKQIDKSTVYMVLDGPIGEGPPWNPAATPTARSYNLLTWTSKMNAPSWSIPAGAPEIGGSCPGATAGQTVVPEGTLVRAAKPIEEVTGEKVDLTRSICNYCYATGGQYATGGVQFAQALRHIWVRQAIMESAPGPGGSESSLFVETMVAAISNANFYLGGGRAKMDDAGASVQSLPPELTGKKFFRIHDSGDFFSPEYFTQWKAVADRLPDVSFWAPSRVWALGHKWIEHVNRVNAEPRNFTVRPSAYHIDGPCPKDLGPGWASGSTVFNESAGALDTAYEWQCDAYATGSHHQCRSAKAPPGMGGDNGRGCRACWIAPNLRINYSPH